MTIKIVKSSVWSSKGDNEKDDIKFMVERRPR
jgi:hypothetical protein